MNYHDLILDLHLELFCRRKLSVHHKESLEQAFHIHILSFLLLSHWNLAAFSIQLNKNLIGSCFFTYSSLVDGFISFCCPATEFLFVFEFFFLLYNCLLSIYNLKRRRTHRIIWIEIWEFSSNSFSASSLSYSLLSFSENRILYKIHFPGNISCELQRFHIFPHSLFIFFRNNKYVFFSIWKKWIFCWKYNLID